ncbi:hypothetical protein [Secundilactobacillus silagei]|uniref:hypothetical protein n=1 Tax=Secundilactobacillus silagei TaxID=1293415 RepID=UPI000AF6A996|nr:hypothetical protein [Secundilactobacillus silagei]
MKITNRLNNPVMAQSRQIRCNKGKCWMHLGIITITLVTGFTVSTTIASAQATTATTEASTTQTLKASDASNSANASSQKGAATASSQSASSVKADSSSSISVSSNNESASSSSASQSSDSTNSAMTDSSSQDSSQKTESKSTQQPAMDVNGHKLDFDALNNQTTNNQTTIVKTTAGAITKATTDKSATNASKQAANNLVVKDTTGNYWLQQPAVDPKNGQPADANTYTQLTDYSYTKNADGSTYSVTGYTGDLQKYLAGGVTPAGGYSTKITLPDTYNGDAVTAIADDAFNNEKKACSSATSLNASHVWQKYHQNW